MNKKILIPWSLVVVLLLCLLGVGAYLFLQQGKMAWSNSIAQVAPLEPRSTAPSTPLPPPSDFSAIVERYGPAVVNIQTTGKTSPASMQDGDSSSAEDPFDFFRFFGPQFPRVPRGSQIIRGEGSGFIVSSDGLILTNAHVIDRAQEVKVRLTDQREFNAKVLGADRQSDVAVLRIDAKNLPTVQLGNPNQVRVGEPVLAIGSPYGFENSASAGIVSAKSRALPDDTYVPFIQTDVAVNPGNSGGPLFNLRGEVIGINSQIYSRTGGYQGLSFAIPIDVASKIKDQLLQHGKVTRGRIGVMIQDVNQALADSFGLKKPEGALVSKVEKDGPAEKAGVEPGDVIVRLGDHPVRRSADLPALVADIQPGTAVELEVIRKGAARQLKVTIGEVPQDKQSVQTENQPKSGKLGLGIRPLSQDEARQVGVNAGLVVEQVTGPAARAGIQEGDVVIACNGSPVKTVDDLRSLTDKAGRRVALLIVRDGARVYIPVDLG